MLHLKLRMECIISMGGSAYGMAKMLDFALAGIIIRS
jgi:hypothetical protein